METKTENFIDEVRRMRQAQKAYFRTRDKSWLVESKKREGNVDRLLTELSNPNLYGETK